MADVAAWLARRRVALGFVCGVIGLWLARPTWPMWWIGCGLAALGEALRVWAAGHLDKNREVTASGPYRLTAHPLYLGSTVMGVGFAIAAANIGVAVMLFLYLATTIPAAIRREEKFLRTRFDQAYDAYRGGRGSEARRRFSLARARRNHEYRAVAGFALIAAILAARAALGR